jgi:predicted permease
VALELLSVFVDVVVPVFAIVGLGFLLGPRLELDARTVSRLAYYVFVPAFMFDVVSRAEVPLGSALRMAGFAAGAHLLFAALGLAVARILRRPPEVAAGYVMVAVFGNVGNFGLALVRFRYGDEGIVPATIYFIVILVTAFATSVAAAAFVRGGGLSAVASVFRTPALLVVPPAALVAALDLPLPLFLTRSVGLLGDAMIPVMLFALGLQLAQTRALRLGMDVLAVSAIRLAVAPALAALLVVPFGLEGLPRATGILQSGMPAAILVSIIAAEYRIDTGFVTAAVFYTTLLSVPTLTVLLALL